MHREGREEILGLAHSDRDLIMFLEAVGVIEPENVLNDPQLLEWRVTPPTSGLPPDAVGRTVPLSPEQVRQGGQAPARGRSRAPLALGVGQ
ncbi:hypothetical protein ACFWC9_34420 [Streptomyces goshikiensis]|uniref:hypothetical protein n=1 Tax=Streptomyces goshikiensis TaxID=1942 RepID=UPI0036CEF24E